MHAALAVALVAGATLALPASRSAAPSASPGPHAAVARVRQEPKEGRGRHEPHPEIRRAMRELEGARATLDKAAHDFGGHRAAAVKSIDEALAQLREALNYDKK